MKYIITCACGTVGKHAGRGMCRGCYGRWMRARDGRKAYYRWTPEREQTLVQMYGTVKNFKLARMMGTTVDSLRGKAKGLGITRKHPGKTRLSVQGLAG